MAEQENAIEMVDSVRLDGVMQNLVTGMGDAAYDKTMHSRVGYQRRLSKEEAEELYGANWICGNVIDAYPFEATRKWLDVKVGGQVLDKKVIDAFNQYQEKLGVRKAFELAGKWSRLYGGAAIVMIAEDGQPIDRPLRPDRVRTVRKLEVLDRYKIRPVTHNADPLNPEFYELILPPAIATNLQQVIKQPIQTGAGILIHHTRVLRFDGVELPPDLLLRNEGWGGSILDRILDSFNHFEMADNAVANMMTEASMFKYAMKNLSGLLDRGDEKSVMKLRTRLASMRLEKGNLKALVYDADGESAEFISRNFAGLPELMDRFQNHMVGASGIPATILFGRGPVGLAAQGTGDSEDKVWSKKVNQYQESVFTPKLRSPQAAGIFDLIWQAQDGPTKGKPPKDWSLEFKPLDEPTQEQIVALREKQANIDRTYKDMEVVLTEEIRASRFEGSEYSIEMVLDKAAWDKKKAEAEASFAEFEDFAPDDDDAGQAQIEEQPALPAAPEPAIAGRTDSVWRSDEAMPIKRILKWKGLKLGVTHDPGDIRHGKPMMAGYCHVRGSYGHAEDGMAIDAYLGPNPTSDRAFKIRQLKPDGTFDESKWILGCDELTQARDLYLRHMPEKLFGGIESADFAELSQYRQDGADCPCAPCQLAKKTKQVKSRQRKSKSRPGRELELIEEEVDREDAAERDIADQITDRLVADSGAIASGWLGQIRDWMSEAGSLEQARDRLPEVYQKLDADKLADDLANWSIVADLAGREEVDREGRDEA